MDNILKVDGVAISPPPSAITPGIEVIKTTEQALDGTICMDVVGERQSLEISWDMLDSPQFKAVRSLFKQGKTLLVEYVCGSDGNGNLFDSRGYYVDALSYMPYIIGGDMLWQDVTVNLVQIDVSREVQS